jgi:hypothetical protein
MLTVRPKDFVVGMRINFNRYTGDNDPDAWTTIKNVYGRFIPHMDHPSSSMIVFETEHGMAVHDFESNVTYPLHPESLPLLSYP